MTEFVVDYVRYSVNTSSPSYGAITVGTSAPPANWDLVIPGTVTYNSVSYNVKKIGNDAFANSTNIKNITIPNSVTEIGDGGFANSGLTNIVSWGGVTQFGLNAFFGCGLTNITFPNDRNITFASNASMGTGSGIFINCTSLTSVTYGAMMTSIQKVMFAGCTSLTSFTNAILVSQLGSLAFYNCPLQEFVMSDLVTSIDAGPFGSAFDGIVALTKFTIGSGLTSIGANVFKGNNNLTTVIFRGTNIPTISATNNFNSSSVDTAYYRQGATNLSRLSGFFQNTVQGWSGMVDAPQNLTGIAGDSAVTISWSAVSGSTKYQISYYNTATPSSITIVDVSGNVTQKEITGLTNSQIYGFNVKAYVNLEASPYSSTLRMTPYSITSPIVIVDYVRYSVNPSSPSVGAFVINYDSPPLNWNVVIPSTVTYNSVSYTVKKISNNAFDTCENLRNITIPNSVTEIGDGGFANSGLTNIVSWGGVTQFGLNAFFGCGLTNITFPNDRNITFASNASMGTGSGIFINCTSLTSVTYGAMMTSIQKVMFAGCTSLTSFTNAILVSQLGSLAFYNCPLQEFVMSDLVTSIDAGPFGSAFDGIVALTKFTIGSGLTSIGTNVFKGNTNLTTVIFRGNNIPTISATNNFNSSSVDTAYYRPGATNLSRLTGFFQNTVEGWAGMVNAPTGVSATPTVGAINSATINWNAVSSSTKYQISYYAIDASSSITTVDVSGNLTQKIISGLTNAKTFTFSVKAYVNLESSGDSSSVTVTPDFVVDYVMYSVNYSSPSDGAFIVGTSGSPANWDLVIPTTITVSGITYNVKKIGNDAFSNIANLKNLTIPNSVTEIGGSAFLSSGLTSIASFGGVTRFGYEAFKQSALKSITLPNDRDFTYGSGYNGHGSTFSLCPSLTSVTYGSMMTEIPPYMFRGCNSINSFTNYGAITSVGDFAFYGATLPPEFIIPDTVTILGRASFAAGGLSKVTIGAGVTLIKQYAFENGPSIGIFRGTDMPTLQGNSGFGTIYYKPGATNVSRLTGYSSVIIEGFPGTFSAPQNVTVGAVNSSATVSWSAVTDSAPDAITRYRISYFNNASSTTISNVDVSGNITEKEITGLTNGQTYSFSVKAYSGDYVSVASSSVTVTPFALNAPSRIWGSATSGAGNSVGLDWYGVTVPAPNTITKYQVSYYATVTPSNIITVDFSGNVSGPFIITGLPDGKSCVFSVKAFVNSSSSPASSSVTIMPYSVFDYVLYSVNSSSPSDGASISGYASSPPSNWDLVIPSSVTFSGVTYNVNNILNSAFGGSTVKSVTFPNNKDITLGGGIFYQCRSLTSVTYGNMMTSISDNMFNQSSLTSFANYGGINSIGVDAFRSLGIPEFIIPDTVTYLAAGALAFSGITKVTIGAGVSDIQAGVFATYQNALQTVIFNGTSIPTISATGDNFGSPGDTAYYRPGATNVSRLTPFFATIIEGLPSSYQAPINVTATGGSASATISWSAVTDSTRYRVRYFNNASPTTISNVDVSGNVTQTVITGLTNGQTYSFSVRAYVNDLVSEASSSVTATPNIIIDSVIYQVTSASDVRIIGSSSPPTNWDLVIPATVTDGGVTYNVKKINDSAFSGLANLKNLTIPNSVTEIGGSAFLSSGLTSIASFGGVTRFGYEAFKQSALKSITLPNDRDFTYGSGYNGHGSTFRNCTSLTSVTYGSMMTEIPAYMFLECSSINSFTNYGAITSVGNFAFYLANLPSEFIIPDTCTSLGRASFAAYGLSKVTIGAGVTIILAYAFERGPSIGIFRGTDMPTLQGNSGFGTIYYKPGATNVSRLTGYSSVIIEGFPGTFSAPQNVTGSAGITAATITWSAVTDSAPDAITKYRISYFNTLSPATITTLDVSGNITQRTITGLTNNQTYSFSLRAYANDYVSPVSASVTATPFAIVKPANISSEARVNAVNVTWSAVSVLSPNTVTKYQISYYDIDTPSNFYTVDVSGNVLQKEITGLTPFKTYAFTVNAWVNSLSGEVSNTTQATPYFLLDYVVYQVTSPTDVIVRTNQSPPLNWDLVIPATVTSSGVTYNVKMLLWDSFIYCANIRNVTIPNSVTEVQGQSFRYSGLTNVVSWGGVTTLGIHAFATCGLKSVTFPNDRDFTFTLAYGPYFGQTFKDCTSLTSVTYGSMITTIPDYMFQGCGSLTSFTNYGGITSIGSDVFNGCSLNQEFIIPDSVSVLNGAALSNSGINKVTIGGLITNIGDYTFSTQQGRLLIAVFKGNDIPIITGTNNFNSTGDTAYYRPGATNVSRLTPFFTNIIPGLPGDFTAPQNVTATSGINEAIINWSAVSSSTTITNYIISYYNTLTPSSISTVDVSGNLTQKIITGLTNFQTYGFSIKAYSGDYMSVVSSTVTATPYSIDAPQNVTGSAGISAATINWSAVTVQSPYTITKYQISYYNTVTSSSITTLDVSSNLTQKEITGLTNFQTYGFSVKAFVNSFSSVASSTVTITPFFIDAPINVTGKAGISAAIINWSAVSVLAPNTITKYQISYYNTVTPSSITTIDVASNLTQKEITGLTIRNSYGFSIKAFVNSLTSASSSTVTVELSIVNVLADGLNNPTSTPPTPTFFYELVTTGFTTQELLGAGVNTIPVTSGAAITNLLQNFDFPTINITSDITIPTGTLQSNSATISISNLTGDSIIITNN